MKPSSLIPSIFRRLWWMLLTLAFHLPANGQEAKWFPLGPINGYYSVVGGSSTALVRSLDAGGPGISAGLQAGDYIYGAFGKVFTPTGGDHYGVTQELGFAVDRAEAGDGVLPLLVLRPGVGGLTINVALPAAGAFGPAYPRNSAKYASIYETAVADLHARAIGNGNLGYLTGFTGICLLGHPNWNDTTGAKPYRLSINKIRDFAVSRITTWGYAPTENKLVDNTPIPNPSGGPSNWELGPLMMFLSEYYAKTNDASVSATIQRGAEMCANTVQWWKQPAEGNAHFQPEYARVAGMSSHGGVTGDYMHLGYCGINAAGVHNMNGLAFARRAGANMNARPKDGHYFGFNVNPGDSIPVGIANALPSSITLPQYAADPVRGSVIQNTSSPLNRSDASDPMFYNPSLAQKFLMQMHFICRRCGSNGNVRYAPEGADDADSVRTTGALLGMSLYQMDVGGMDSADLGRIEAMKQRISANYMAQQRSHVYCFVAGQTFQAFCTPLLSDRQQRYALDNWRFFYALSRTANNGIRYISTRTQSDGGVYLNNNHCASINIALPYGIANGGYSLFPAYNTNRSIANFKSPVLMWPSLAARTCTVTAASQAFQVDVCDGNGNVLDPSGYTATWSNVSGPDTATFSSASAANTTVTFPSVSATPYRIRLTVSRAGVPDLVEDIDVTRANPPTPIAPSIATQPVAQSSAPGGNVSFTVGMAGDGPFIYQWKLDGVAYWAASPNPTLTLTNVSGGNIGSYECVITTPTGTLFSNAVSFTLSTTLARVSNGLKKEVWTGITGTSVSSLTGTANFPRFPSSASVVTAAEGQINTDNCGERLSGWVKPPVSGSYRFYMSGDDAAELWLSTDASPANKVRIIDHPSGSSFRSYDGVSANISLVAGQKYYIEILHKEAGGSDHVSVAWQIPGEAAPTSGTAPIPGIYLEYDSYLPLLTNRWAFDETSGSTRADSVGGATATLYNSPSPTTGQINGALSFNGSNQYAQATLDVSEQIYAVSLWFRTSQASGGLFSVVAGGGGYDRGIFLSGGNISAYIWSNETISSNGQNFADGQWHHVLHTFGGSIGGQKLYVDGAQVAVGAKSQSDFNWQTAIKIGHAGNGGYFNGEIDDVRVYNSGLSVADATELYNAGLNASPQVSAATFTVAENSANGTAVGTVSATDSNAGQALSYSIVGGNIGNRFAIHPSSGLITVAGALNHEVISSNVLTVRATDSGTPAAYGEANILINITDLNDAPAFPSNPVVANAAVPGIAYSGSISATDEDPGSSITFSKVGGPAWLAIAGDGFISGTPNTGDIGINDFTVRATDNAGLFTDVILRVDVVNLSVTPIWTNTAGGSWPVTGNWLSGTVGNGSTMFPDFSTLNLTDNATVTLDGSRTIGGLKFGDTIPSHNWTLSTGSSGPLTLARSSGTPVITVTNQTTTINNVLAGSQGMVKAGAGTLALTTANTYTGATTIDAGSLKISRPASGTAFATSSFAVNAGSTLEFHSNGAAWAVPAKPIGLNGGALAFTANAGAGQYASGFGVVSVNSPSFINISAGSAGSPNASSLHLDGGLQGSGGVTVTSATNGLGLVLRNSSTNYSGSMTVNGNASTAVGAGSGLALGAGVLMSSADIIVNGTMEMGNSGMGWAVSGVTGTTFQMDALGGTGVVVANMGTASSTRTLSIGNNNGSAAFSGVIANGANNTLSLIKSGTGTQILSGVSTYTGTTTVNAGTLIVDGSLANSTTTVAAAATLGGSGSIGGAVTMNGALALGSNGIGSLIVNNTITFAPASIIDWDISDWTGSSGVGCDLLTAAAVNITATSGSPLTLRLHNLDLINFADLSKSFVIAQATGAVTGFSADKIVIDSTGMAMSSGVWSIELSDNNLLLVYTSNNQPPSFVDNPIQAYATEDSSFSGQLSASDPNAGDTLTYEKLSGPEWLSISPTGVLSGTPDNGSVGANMFSVLVRDQGGASGTGELVVSVTNTNDAPVISNDSAPVDIQSGIAFNGQLASFDPDEGDAATYSKVSGPAWLVVAPDGKLSGMPGAGTGGINTFTVRVTDSVGATGDGVINFNVNDSSTGIAWINPSGGSWPTGANWQGGTAASGSSQAANFSTLDLTANAAVTLDGSRTIGGLIFDDATPSHNWTINAGSGGSLTLALPSGTPVVTVGNQTTTINAVVAGNQGLVKTGPGTLDLTAANTFTGQTTVNTGALTISGAGKLGSGSYAGAISNNGTVRFSSSSAQTLSGAISGPGDFIKEGSGMVTLAGTNTYTGPTTVNAGTLRQLRPVGIATSTTTVNSGGILDFHTNDSTWVVPGMPIALNGGTLSFSASGLNGKYASGFGAVTVLTPSTITLQSLGGTSSGSNRSNLFLDGGLKGSADVTITSSASGLGLVLRNANTNYGGKMTVNGTASAIAGTGSGVALAPAAILTNADITVNGTLEIGNGATGLGWGTGGPATGAIAMDALDGTGVVVGNFASGSNTRTLSVGNSNGSGSYSGQIVNGTSNTLSFTKNGTGTQILSGTSTYTGATSVNAGTLLINGNLANTATTIAAAGTLGGSGSTAGTVTNNGTLAPGNNAVGSLTVNNTLTLSNDSSVNWEVSDWSGAAGTGYDTITATSLNITATSANRATIRLSEAALANFSETSANFVLIQTSSGITGFSADKFIVDTSALVLPQGTWTVQQSGNNLMLAYTRPNTAPHFAVKPIAGNINEDAPIGGSISAIDPDLGETLAFAKDSGPAWLIIAPNGALSGTPVNSDVGVNSFNVRVTDSFGTEDTATLQIAVANTNDAPVFTSNPITGSGATEDTAYASSIAGTAADMDVGDTLTYSKVSGPGWLSVASDGALSGTPSNSDVGANAFTVRVTDGSGAFANATLNISVANTNDAPTFASNPITGSGATEDAAYSGTLAGTVTDIDAGDALTYSKVSGPAWLGVASNGALSGTPTNGDIGENSFTVKVTDAAGANATATLNITVTNVNDAPIWATGTITKADASEAIPYSSSLAGDASDEDAGDTLTYSKVSGPAWLNVASNGTLSGTPAISDLGANTFTVRVTDISGASADATLSVNVISANGVWTNIAGGTWPTGTNWSGGTVANGMGKSADFGTLNLTADTTVTLNGGRTIGNLVFGDITPSHNWTLNAGSGGALTLDVASGGTPAIAVNNQTVTIGVPLAGTKGLQKTGTGTAILNAANTYTGGTTIVAGVLEIGGSLGSGNYAGTIANNGTLRHNSSTAQVLSGELSGTGTLIKQGGTGDLTLTAVNTYTGATTINGGVLEIGGAGSLNFGAYAGAIANAGTLKYSSSAAQALSGVISGVGGLVKDGGGVLTISGANTYSGTTTVNAGTLKFTGSSVTSSGTIFSGGGTVELANASLSMSGATSAVRFGSGFTGLIKITQNFAGMSGTSPNGAFASNLGSLDITSGKIFWINAATIKVDALTGAGTVQNAAVSTYAPATLTFGVNGGSGTFSGVIGCSSAGNGRISLVKEGAGTQTLSNTVSGANAGTMTVNGGTLILTTAQNYTGATTVQSGTLAGTGSLASATTVQSGGTLAPGSSGIGTLAINNTLSLSGTAQMEISKSGGTFTADKVSGVSTVTYGGTLTVTNIGPDALVAGNTFQLFSATTYSGSFATLNLPTLGASLAWDTSRLTADGTIAVFDTENGGLPAGWAKADIGSPSIAGTSSESGGVFTLAGSGTGFANGSDQAHFIWQTLSGDGEVKVRLGSMSGGDATNATAGVMIRESTLAGSRFASCIRKGDGSMQLIRRLSSGGNITTTTNGTNSTPVWVRLVRAGNTITAYKSTDGTTWTPVSTDTVTMASQISIGVLTSSGNNTSSTTATFDNVLIVP